MASVWAELRRRNVVKVAVAYAIVGWLLVEVASVVLPTFKAPEWIMQVFTFLVIVGFPLALILAWAFELTPEGIKREKDVDRSQSITHVTGRNIDYIIIAALSVALVFFAFTHDWGGEEVQDADITADKSIAVLPFVNMSDDPGNEYFSDGIAEELLNVLIKVEGLRVVSRTSSFAFKGKDISIPDIARKLNVDHVLEGSVRKAGNTVRVTAQLIDVRTDSHLWSGTYDRELEDIFAIQDEISGQIVQALKIALGASDQEAMAHARKPTENLEAYELYLKGRYFWQRRGEDNIRHAIDLFEQATAIDPQFARAWSSLAAAHMTMPVYSDASFAEQHPLAVSAAQKALMLDDTLAETYAVLGDLAHFNKKWAEAEAYFLHAITSEPRNSTAHLWYGEHLTSLGRIRDGLEETLIAYQLDPLHGATNNVLAQIYIMLDDLHNMLKYSAAAADLGNIGGLRLQAMANLRFGEVDRAIELAEQYDEENAKISRLTFLKLLIEAKVDAEKSQVFLETLTEHEIALPIWISLPGYVGFGKVDDAYRLANMYGNRDRTGYWSFLWLPDMVAFRQDPRFAELVTELGLMDYWREHGWPDVCQQTGDSLICE